MTGHIIRQRDIFPYDSRNNDSSRNFDGRQPCLQMLLLYGLGYYYPMQYPFPVIEPKKSLFITRTSPCGMLYTSSEGNGAVLSFNTGLDTLCNTCCSSALSESSVTGTNSVIQTPNFQQQRDEMHITKGL